MSKKSRRLFRQRMNDIYKRHTDYQKHIILDSIDTLVSYYNNVYKSSNRMCSSIVVVRSKKHLNKAKSKLKNHWFNYDTTRAIYGKSYCPQPRKPKVKRKKVYRVLNTLKFERLRKTLRGEVIIKEYINPVILNMLKAAAA